MASDWRLNVWRIGWSGSIVRLASRVHEYPGYYLLALANPGYTLYCLYLPVGPGQHMTFTILLHPPASHPHYPYGYHVDPD